MRRALIKSLNQYRKVSRWWMGLRGQTPEDQAAARVMSGQSWAEFCDTLKAAGASLSFPGTPQTPFDQAEGYRYLTRLTRAGLEAFVEYADPARPVLHRVVHETVKMGSDNPDNYYQTARISGAREYRIWGQRNTIAYLSFGSMIGHYGQSAGMPPTGYIEGSQLHVEDDGSFEIILSASPQPGKNWLPMTHESGTLVVRQTFLDRKTELPAELHIECRDLADSARMDANPQPLTPAMLDEGLRATSSLVAGASLLFAKWARDFKAHSNTLPMFDPARSTAAGGDPNIVYYHSHWALAPDQALVIEVTPPACEHWNFQLNNYWMESLDYRHFCVHVNKHSAHYEPDGSVRIVVAHTNPGVPNWIRTLSHESGTMCFRWVRADQHPQPRTRVVTLAQLRAQLEVSPS